MLPFILWTVKRNEVKDIAQTSKRVLNFQITWCILYFLIFAFILGNVFFHFNIRLPVHFSLSPEILLLFFPAFYGYNIIMVGINAILQFKGKRLFYMPAMKLFR
ncbi:DUF4870 domain-containing protein [Mucilaginibacter sp. PAMB04168]|uniref:DUF4870 domain-containing protein n=1 Tax=Mucilaginibacter sp. PAMB04168 TaxID=3138567 RepID=UPI00333047D6